MTGYDTWEFADKSPSDPVTASCLYRNVREHIKKRLASHSAADRIAYRLGNHASMRWDMLPVMSFLQQGAGSGKVPVKTDGGTVFFRYEADIPGFGSCDDRLTDVFIISERSELNHFSDFDRLNLDWYSINGVSRLRLKPLRKMIPDTGHIYSLHIPHSPYSVFLSYVEDAENNEVCSGENEIQDTKIHLCIAHRIHGTIFYQPVRTHIRKRRAGIFLSKRAFSFR